MADLIDAAIARLAEHQYGVITKRQALGSAATVPMMESRLDQGRWISEVPGVYRISGAPGSWRQGLMVAALAAGEGGGVSHRAAAGEDCLFAAAAAWSAFRLDEPSSLASLSGEKHASLPYLATALRRLVEEYPCASTGLSRTERQILEAVRELGPDPARPGDTFKLSQAREEARFAGDAFVWTAMGRLSQQPAPLLATDDGSPLPKPSPGPDPFGARLTLTEAGAAVLGGKRNAVDCVGIDRWIGGVRLKAEDHWRREGDRLFPSEV